jgi:3-phosphoshikimate 1-carboxyvinyltransferase
MRAVISPGRAEGTVCAPPSKSMAHRMLIAAALSRGTSLIRRADPSEDVLATADCLRALGASVVREGDGFRVTGCDPRETSFPPCIRIFECRESASTLRFLLPLSLLSREPALFCGSETLLDRPLSVYEHLCRERGIRLERRDGGIYAEGRLTPGEYRIPGDVSSQFVSGLLFALPFLGGDSVLRLIPPVVSRPYIDMTARCLADRGVGIRREDELTFCIPGRSVCLPGDSSVEGDYSNAAFFEALNYAGGNVRVTGLSPDSMQGDRICADLFRKLADGPHSIDLSDCPDLAPILFCVAAVLHGGTFTGTGRLRFKESDREAAMIEELAKFGIRTESGKDSLTVLAGPLTPPEVPLSSHNDHRIAMALSVLCVRTGGAIDGAEAVRKSFPDYWDRLKSLKIGVRFPESDPPDRQDARQTEHGGKRYEHGV